MDIFDAIRNSDVDEVRRLINSGANLHVRLIDVSQYTPLHYACLFDNEEIVDLLLNSGAEINIRDMYGNTPLIDVADLGNIKYAKKLLKKGADVNAQNDWGQTALWMAAGNYDSDMIKLLMDYGADPHLETSNPLWHEQNTPFIYADKVDKAIILENLFERNKRKKSKKNLLSLVKSGKFSIDINKEVGKFLIGKKNKKRSKKRSKRII